MQLAENSSNRMQCIVSHHGHKLKHLALSDTDPHEIVDSVWKLLLGVKSGIGKGLTLPGHCNAGM